MSSSNINGFFITGTDTDVGKTHVSVALVEQLKQKGYKTGVMKPISAGCERTAQGLRNDDAIQLMQSSNVALNYDTVNPYAFEPAIAPHIAANEVDVEISLDVIMENYNRICSQSDWVIVEGAGGWLVPLDDHRTMGDLASAIGLPVIVVVGMRLGCLSHALLTINAIKASGLTLAGWIANRPTPEMSRYKENLATLKEMINAPMLGEMPYLPHAPAEERSKFIKLLD